MRPFSRLFPSISMTGLMAILLTSAVSAADAGMECLSLYPVFYTLQTGDSAKETRPQRLTRTEQLLASRLQVPPERISKILLPLAENISRSSASEKIDLARARFVLGLFEECQAQALEAGDQAHRSEPRKPELVIAALHLAALAAIEQSKPEDAVKFVSVALGETSADKNLKTWTLLQKTTARAYHWLGLKKDEERVQRYILTEHQRLLGEDHVDTISQQSELAGMLYLHGDDLESERETRAVLRATLRRHGADSEQAGIVRKNLARVLEAQGRHGEAEPLRKAVLEALLKNAGDKTPPTLAAREALVKNLAAQKKYPECEAEARVLIEAAQDGGSPDTTLITQARIHFAIAVFGQGRPEEALKMLDQLQSDSTRVFGPEHAQTLLVAHTLGSCLNALQKYEEAVPVLSKTLDARKRVLPADDLATLATREQLGLAFLNLGRLKEALTEIRITSLAYERIIPANDPRRALVTELSTRFSNLEEGRQILVDEHRENYRTVAGSLGAEDLQTLNVQAGLASFLVTLDRADEAREEYRKVLAICRRKLGAENSATADIMQRIALIDLNAGRLEACEKQLREVYAIRKKLAKADDLGAEETVYHLGVCLGQMGQLRQADEMVSQSLSVVKGHPQANTAFVAQMEQMQARIRAAMAPKPPAEGQAEGLNPSSLSTGTLQQTPAMAPAANPRTLPPAVTGSRIPDIDPASLVPTGTIQKPLEYKP